MSTQALEAERAILGLVLAQRLPVRDVSELAPTDFDGPGHCFVWEAMLSLAAEGRGPDHLLVAERLKARGRLPEVGLGAAPNPAAYLMGMDQTLAAATPAAVRGHVLAIREAAQRRALERAGRHIIGLAHDPSTPPARAALEGAQALQSIKSMRPLRMGGKDVIALNDEWDRAMRGEVQPYLPVPHATLAEVFPGFVDNLNVVGGRAGSFKTGFMADCIWHWTHDLGHRGGVFGLEDGTGWAFKRLTARELGMDYGKVGFARLNDMQTEIYPAWCERAFPVLNERLFVYDTSDSDTEALAADTPIADWPDVLQEVKRWLSEGVRFIVIDHGLRINYLRPESRERYDVAIGKAMDTLANLGARHRCAIIVLWHLNRDGEETAIPQKKDIKESSYLDAAMRSCLVNWKHPDFPGNILSTVVKNTRGPDEVTVALEKEQGGRFGLLHRSNGRVVDFAAEARARAEAKKTAKTRLFPGPKTGDAA